MIFIKHYKVSILSLGLLVLAFGCSPAEQGTGRAGDESAGRELFFYCGAGLRPVMSEIVELFTAETGIQLRVDYNASSLLLGKMKISRDGDLFMPGDVYYVDQAAEHGLIEESRKVAAFVPVIMVGQGNPKRIGKVADLAQPGLRLGLADPRTAAIGRISRQIFEKNQVPPSEFEANLVYDSVTVPELATAVELGSIDAAIVWEPVARGFARAEVVVIPESRNVVVPVPLAVLSVSENRQAARRFVDFVLSEPGIAAFKRHHFGEITD